ncbi:MAG: sugar ABC transporter ATP-binding protein [Anaerolineae bacterium]
MSASETPYLEFVDVSKRFGNTQALNAVSFAVNRGEVRGLAGENGAGKSTLIKILCGVFQADSGHITLDGQVLRLRSPAEAEALGISVFHQEIPLCLNLSVAANVFLAPQMPGRLGFPDWAEMAQRCEELFDILGERIEPRKLVRDCTAAEKQMVLLARVLSRQARLIVLDEPTTALTPPDIERLFAVINRLKQQEITFIFVSHMLEEIMALADRITVLRNGEYTGTLERSEYNPERLSQMIVGREVISGVERQRSVESAPVLEAEGISLQGQLENVSLRVRAGEIVGVAGLQGSGKAALVRCLFGAPPPDRGQLRVNGRAVQIRSPQDAMRLGIGYVPEDRKLLGLFFALDVKKNLGMAQIDQLTRRGLLEQDRLRASARGLVDQLHIVTRSVDAPVTSLSGGNQQKVLFGRWLAMHPRVLVMHEPTRGVDVGAKAEIRRLIVQLADEGYAFVVASSDLDELLIIADRILVMHRGRIAAEFVHGQVSKEQIIVAATMRRESQD